MIHLSKYPNMKTDIITKMRVLRWSYDISKNVEANYYQIYITKKKSWHNKLQSIKESVYEF